MFVELQYQSKTDEYRRFLLFIVGTPTEPTPWLWVFGFRWRSGQVMLNAAWPFPRSSPTHGSGEILSLYVQTVQLLSRDAS